MQSAETKSKVFQAIFIFCLGIFIFFLFYEFIQTEDIWWHLSTGRWIVQHLQVPREDIFPFANERTPWACNNEWLGTVLLFLIVKTGGLLGLKVFKSLFFIFILGILFCYSYKRLPFLFLLILTILAALGLADRAFLRPDILNLFFIQAFLIILFEHEDKGEAKNLWILPVLSLIWFNIHLGAFAYGLPLLFIFFLSACIRYFNLTVAKAGADEIAIAKKRPRELVLTLLVSLACFLMNPYGLQGLLFPIKVILFPNTLVTMHSQEMLPPWYIFNSFNHSYYFILFITALTGLFFNKKNNFTLTILLFFSLFAFLYAQRNSSFFILTCSYVIVRGFDGVRFDELLFNHRYLRAVKVILYAGVAIFLLTQVYHCWGQKGYYGGQLINDRHLEINPVSEGPIKLLLREKITGPVFNDEVLGDLIIWMGYPALRPFFDGRNIMSDRRENESAIFSHPIEVWPMAERDYHLKIVILNTANDQELPLVMYLKTQASWQLIAVNGPLVTYVKKGEFKLPEGLDGFQVQVRSKRISADDLRDLKGLLNREHRSRLEEFLHPSADYVDLFSDGLTYFRLGYRGAALEDLVRALKISDQPYMNNMAGFILKQLDNEPSVFNTN